MNASRKQKRVMTQVETVKLAELMKVHIRTIPGEDRVCEYIGDYDDEKIAKEVAPDLNVGHAANLRKALFGDLRKPPPDGPLQERVERLEVALGNALNHIQELTTKHDMLCKALSVARGGSVDARHLVIDPKAVHGQIAGAAS